MENKICNTARIKLSKTNYVSLRDYLGNVSVAASFGSVGLQGLKICAEKQVEEHSEEEIEQKPKNPANVEKD